MYRNGPVQGHQQFLSLNILGPFVLIGSFLHAWKWAQSSSLTVSLFEHTGPIRAHWQFSPCIGMGPFKVIDSFSHWIYWVLRLDFIHTQIHQTASFLFSPPPHRSPCTIQSRISPVCNMISCFVHVQYDLWVLLCMISISEPPLLQYLVLGEFRSLST